MPRIHEVGSSSSGPRARAHKLRSTMSGYRFRIGVHVHYQRLMAWGPRGWVHQVRFTSSSPRGRATDFGSGCTGTSKGSSPWVHKLVSTSPVHELGSTSSCPRGRASGFGSGYTRASKGLSSGPRARIHELGSTSSGPRAWVLDVGLPISDLSIQALARAPGLRSTRSGPRGQVHELAFTKSGYRFWIWVYMY